MYKNIKIEIPKDAAYILNFLESHGFEAFFVGGCVRDSIIGIAPQDWDISTDAKPQEVKQIFQKTIDTGIKHGTVTALYNSNAYEITTYRIDGKYINNRKPETVAFTNSIEADLGRRDFTINAMAYNPSVGLLDLFGGIEDIESKQIRTVGKAEHRFEEDALRMLRAARFSAQLNYSIESNTLTAMEQRCSLLSNISGERIKDELNKILLANPMIFELLHNTGILRNIIPELDLCFLTEQKNPYHVYNVGMHSLRAASSTESSLLLRWTMLLHDIGKAYVKTTDSKGIDHFYKHQKISELKADQLLHRLRFDNASIAIIKKLILEHDRQIGDSEKSVRKAVAAIGADLFEIWLQVRLADIMAQNPDKAPEKLAKLNTMKSAYDKIIADKQCLTLKDLAVNGIDLMEIGFPEGKKLGEMLHRLFAAVLEKPELNNRDMLLNIAREYI